MPNVKIANNPNYSISPTEWAWAYISSLPAAVYSQVDTAMVSGVATGVKVAVKNYSFGTSAVFAIAFDWNKEGGLKATITGLSGTFVGMELGAKFGALFGPEGIVIGAIAGIFISVLTNKLADMGYDGYVNSFDAIKDLFESLNFDIDNDVLKISSNDISKLLKYFEENSYNDLLHPARHYFDEANNRTQPTHDPIIFDLNGDGVKTTTIQNGAYFDYAGDGFAESTAWVDANDGILFNDVNGNGAIDNTSELITSLASYDTNGDGIINSSDSAYSTLKVLKGDGTLETLTDAGITSINVATTNTNTTDSNGNTQLWSGTYTNASGATLAIGDYNLQSDPTYSVETSTIAVSDTIAALPDVSSYGKVHSLHQAMAA